VQNIHQGSFKVGMGILDEITGKELNEFNVNVKSFSANKI